MAKHLEKRLNKKSKDTSDNHEQLSLEANKDTEVAKQEKQRRKEKQRQKRQQEDQQADQQVEGESQALVEKTAGKTTEKKTSKKRKREGFLDHQHAVEAQSSVQDSKIRKKKDRKRSKDQRDEILVSDGNLTVLGDSQESSSRPGKVVPSSVIQNQPDQPSNEDVKATCDGDDQTRKQKKKKKKSSAEKSTDVKDNCTLKTAGDGQADGQSFESNVDRDCTQLPDAHEAFMQSKKPPRFIVFIGNLPFTATKVDVEKHFKSIQPAAIRLMTHKDTGVSKGFGFLEFDRFDHMKTCLRLYHHSSFDDGKSSTRKINVELTAGGGGSKSNRMDKIKTKNEKLQGERHRNKQSQEDEKYRQANMSGKTPVEQEDTGSHGMHPSRLARMQ